MKAVDRAYHAIDSKEQLAELSYQEPPPPPPDPPPENPPPPLKPLDPERLGVEASVLFITLRLRPRSFTNKFGENEFA